MRCGLPCVWEAPTGRRPGCYSTKITLGSPWLSRQPPSPSLSRLTLGHVSPKNAATCARKGVQRQKPDGTASLARSLLTEAIGRVGCRHDKRSVMINGDRAFFASVGIHYPRFTPSQWVSRAISPRPAQPLPLADVPGAPSLTQSCDDGVGPLWFFA